MNDTSRGKWYEEDGRIGILVATFSHNESLYF